LKALPVNHLPYPDSLAEREILTAEVLRKSGLDEDAVAEWGSETD
jgi:hypothetical protein